MDDNHFGPLTGMVKPKFAIIDAALKNNSYDNTSDLHVYVDLTDIIYRTLKHSKLINEMQFSETEQKNFDIIMAADILRIFHHWLLYINKRGVSGKVVMIMNGYDMTKVVESEQSKLYLINHRSRMANSSIVHKYWKSAISIVKKLVDYIPNCYFVDTNEFDAYTVPYILDNDNKSCHKLIMTSAPIFTTYNMLPEYTVIVSKIRKSGIIHQFDNTEIIQSLTHVDEPMMSAFSRNRVFYNIILGIVGDESRSLLSIQIQISIMTLATNLLRNIEKGVISDRTQSVETVYSLMDERCTEYIKKVYPLIDLEQHSLMIKPSMIEKIKAGMIDIYDLEGCPQVQLGDLNLMELVYI